MIRAIGNTPAPAPMPAPEPTPEVKLRRQEAPAPEPAPEPVPTEGGDAGKNLAFKGIVIKNIPGEIPMIKYHDFIYSAKPIKELRYGVSRADLEGRPKGTFLSYFRDMKDVLRGKTRAEEEEVYKTLVANKHMIPGIEIHKIDDWA